MKPRDQASRDLLHHKVVGYTVYSIMCYQISTWRLAWPRYKDKLPNGRVPKSNFSSNWTPTLTVQNLIDIPFLPIEQQKIKRTGDKKVKSTLTRLAKSKISLLLLWDDRNNAYLKCKENFCVLKEIENWLVTKINLPVSIS